MTPTDLRAKAVRDHVDRLRGPRIPVPAGDESEAAKWHREADHWRGLYEEALVLLWDRKESASPVNPSPPT